MVSLSAACLVTASLIQPVEASTEQSGNISITLQDESKCVSASNGHVCGFLYGTERYVSTVTIEREKVPPNLICDYQGRFEVFNSSNSLLYGVNSGRRQDCTPYAWFDFNIRRNFPSAAKACFVFYEYGRVQGQRFCVYPPF